MRAKFYIYQPWLTLVARLILGGVLLAAGGLKIGNLQKSAMAVRAYEMFAWRIHNACFHYCDLSSMGSRAEY
jgi:uncharacterized membrane protein YphA (DoxX/SURF4 family)